MHIQIPWEFGFCVYGQKSDGIFVATEDTRSNCVFELAFRLELLKSNALRS